MACGSDVFYVLGLAVHQIFKTACVSVKTDSVAAPFLGNYGRAALKNYFFIFYPRKNVVESPFNPVVFKNGIYQLEI